MCIRDRYEDSHFPIEVSTESTGYVNKVSNTLGMKTLTFQLKYPLNPLVTLKDSVVPDWFLNTVYRFYG